MPLKTSNLNHLQYRSHPCGFFGLLLSVSGRVSKAHCSKSRQVAHIARIHLLNVDIQIVIPTQGGNRIFATNIKTAPPHVTSVINKIKQINDSYVNFQESKFSSILAAEVLKKAEVAVPRSTGIKQNNGSRPARGSHVCVLQHPWREDANCCTCVLQALMPKVRY